MRLKKNDLQGLVDLVNTTLFSMKKENIDYIPLGPLYSIMSYEDVQDNLIKHRLVKKFDLVDAKSAADMKRNDIIKMINYDSSGMKQFQPALIKMSSATRAALYKARAQIHETFRNYRLSLSNANLPSGESSVSSQGNVSIFAKLSDRKQWCVTADCFDYAATLIYQTNYLKKQARHHMPAYEKADNDMLWYSFCHLPAKQARFEIFKCKLLDFMTIVDGSRLTTVPKNNDEGRVINCEPMFNMLVQFCISASFRDVLKKFGLDLDSAQEVHRRMILDAQVCTIDLSRASDSNWLPVIKFLYPTSVYNSLVKARSPVGTFDDIKHVFNMLSPMGNGFTFEVMTATLFFTLAQFDSNVRVFGDDIILDKKHGENAKDLLSVLGYKTNVQKTYTFGPFKESCGGFTYAGKYLKSYDFTFCINVNEAIAAINKLIILAGVAKWIRPWLDLILEKVSLLWVWDVPITEIHGNYICYNCRKLKRTDKEYMALYKSASIQKTVRDMITSYQWKAQKVEICVSHVVKTHDYVTLKRWNRIPKFVKNTALIGQFLYTGRCVPPHNSTKHYVFSEVIFH